MLISEVAPSWLNQRRTEGFSPHTIRGYEIQMRLLIEAIGDIPVDQITLAALREYVGGPRCAHLKPASLAHRVRAIKAFCTWLSDEEYVSRSPAHKLKEPKLPQRVPRGLTFEEIELIEEACKTTREHAIVEFLLHTGCRASELCSVKRSDVDWERRCVVVWGKGSKEREVYFKDRAKLWLRRYLDFRKDGCEYLFVTERGTARQISTRDLWHTVKRVANRVGLREKVHPHSMRHTLATSMLNRGAPLHVVQSILGHEKPETTMIYAHLSGSIRQAEYERYGG